VYARTERVVFFQGALHEQRDRTLRGVEARVWIEAAGLHQVIDDQRGVGDAHASVFDERQFALGTRARIGGIDDLVGNRRNAQPGFELAAERADVRNPEHARKLKQFNGRIAGHGFDPPYSPETLAANAPRRPFQPLAEWLGFLKRVLPRWHGWEAHGKRPTAAPMSEAPPSARRTTGQRRRPESLANGAGTSPIMPAMKKPRDVIQPRWGVILMLHSYAGGLRH
jgi:hypothetical protein